MAHKQEEYVCIHEEKFQEQESKLERLTTRVEYKEEKINQIILDNQRMEEKIDKITESIHQLQLNSTREDFNIDNRVTSLETTVKVLKWIIAFSISAIAIIISGLTFALTHMI